MTTPTKITLQQIIDAAWQRFIVEDAPPAVEDDWCSYRTKDGRACAVGLCIPDGHAATESGNSLGHLVKQYADLFHGSVRDWDRYLLNKFQERLHDCLQFGGEWCDGREDRAEAYRAVARDYGLTLPNGGVL